MQGVRRGYYLEIAAYAEELYEVESAMDAEVAGVYEADEALDGGAAARLVRHRHLYYETCNLLRL